MAGPVPVSEDLVTRPQHRTTRTGRPTGRPAGRPAGRPTGRPTGSAAVRERGASDAQQAVAVLLIVALGAVAAAVLQHL